MIGTIIKLGIFLVICLLGYNYFFGTVEEKENTRVIVGKAKELGKDAWGLLRSERSKMKEGKYDDALDRLDGLYTNLKETATEIKDSKALEEIGKLADRRAELEEMLRDGGELSKDAQRKLDDLAADTEDVMNEMEAKSKSPAPY